MDRKNENFHGAGRGKESSDLPTYRATTDSAAAATRAALLRLIAAESPGSSDSGSSDHQILVQCVIIQHAILSSASGHCSETPPSVGNRLCPNRAYCDQRGWQWTESPRRLRAPEVSVRCSRRLCGCRGLSSYVDTVRSRLGPHRNTSGGRVSGGASVQYVSCRRTCDPIGASVCDV